MKLTVVIPTYNEAENLPRLAAELLALPLPDLRIQVVDDNSPDGTGRLAEDLAVQTQGRVSVMNRRGKRGFGSAILAGFNESLASGAEAVLQMDADFSHPVAKIMDLADALRGCDFAIGSRYVEGGKLDERWPFWRKALSGFGNFYARGILGMPIRDVTGGFVLWRAATLAAMPLAGIRSNGYVFQVELKYIASRMGYHCREVPIYFADRRWGKSKMNFRIQIEAAIRTWQLLRLYRHLKPNKSA